jgi:aminopeptidase 2
MVSRDGTVNLSNMPVKSEQPFTESYVGNQSLAQYAGLKSSDGGWKVTKFETTPLISSYLVAYANGPFEYIEGSYTSPISGKVRPVRMYGAYTSF